MSDRKIKVWLDSRANIYSRHELIFTLEDLGFTDDEWETMNMLDRDEVMQEIAFENFLEWGYEEV